MGFAVPEPLPSCADSGDAAAARVDAGEQEDAGHSCDEQAKPAWAMNGHEALLGSETVPCSVDASDAGWNHVRLVVRT